MDYILGNPKQWPAKDTSWQAWLIVVMCSVTNAAILTILYSFGIFVTPLAEYFDTGRGNVAWISSIMALFGFVMGLPAGMLNARIGSQRTVMIGAVFLLVGAVASSYAESLVVLFLTCGALVGVSVALGTISTMSCVATWFDKYRGIAIGLASVGSAIGNLAGPLVASSLMEVDGPNNWQFALRWIGVCTGILAFVAGIFLPSRPPNADAKEALEEAKKVPEEAHKEDMSAEEEASKTQAADATVDVEVITVADPPDPVNYARSSPDDIVAHASKSFVSDRTTHETVMVEIFQATAKTDDTQGNDDSSTSAAVLAGFTVRASTPAVTWKYDSVDSTEDESSISSARGSDKACRERISFEKRQSSMNFFDRRQSSINLPFGIIHPTPAIHPTHTNANANVRLTESPVKLALKTEYYRLFLAVSLCVMLSFNIPTVHLPAFVEDQGESSNRAASLISILGGAQVVGRIAHGHFADRYGAVNCMAVGTAVMGVMGVLWTMVPYSWAWIVTFTIFFGFNVGTVTSLPSTVLAEYFEGIDLSNLLGLYFSVGAPTGLAGPTIAGYIYDGLGSYDLVGWLTGLPMIVGLFILLRMSRIRSSELRMQRSSAGGMKAGFEMTPPRIKALTPKMALESSMSDAANLDGELEEMAGSSASRSEGEPAGKLHDEYSRSTSSSVASESSILHKQGEATVVVVDKEVS